MSPPSDESRGELERRLADQYQEMARLAGGLAHEIKNPLSTIRLNMELLAEDLADGDSLQQRRALRKVEVVQRECQRLQNLLDDFLNFTKVRQLRLEPVDLNAVVGDVLDLFAPQAEQAGVQVFRYLDPDLPTVLLDRESFHASLLNLVLNAQQAMSDGGQLTVRTSAIPFGVRLDVIDTGCGIDDRILEKMWQTFYSTKSGGSGLGLPTARKIIEAHGGSIHVQSEPGRGTQFTIELPTPARLA